MTVNGCVSASIENIEAFSSTFIHTYIYIYTIHQKVLHTFVTADKNIQDFKRDLNSLKEPYANASKYLLSLYRYFSAAIIHISMFRIVVLK